jgi:site-specific DNA-methyltransferase (adenine-specific)
MSQSPLLLQGDCKEVLKTLAPDSIEAAVSDPPYGLGDMSPARVAECLAAWTRGEEYQPTGAGFMGKAWDAWTPGPDMWRELYRVLKPGAHALIFAGSRTQDLMSLALRLAGFEIRDTLQWLYGSGFPKSHNIDKAIDKALGAEREVIGSVIKYHCNKGDTVAWKGKVSQGRDPNSMDITAPTTDAARAWEGWGTALKPAYEPIILARKPLAGTVVQNTLEHGCGGLYIGGCRVAWSEGEGAGYTRPPSDTPRVAMDNPLGAGDTRTGDAAGRWPANVLLDEGAAEVLDAQAPGASRFFYTAKASRAEREAGLDGHETKTGAELTGRAEGSVGLSAYAGTRGAQPRANTHPTVKPIELMRYLVRLITPPGASVIDPFMGSGSTGCAAVLEGARFVGIEREAEYMNIARARIAHHTPAPPSPAPPSPADEQLSLFDTDTGTQEP